MIQLQKITKPDIIGAAASSLCVLHCMATPLLFLASTCTITGCIDTPVWWKTIDYVFLTISFIAIQMATKNSTKKWVEIALFSSWALLLIAILNETFEVVNLTEFAIYIPAFGMAALHLYNQKYCKCNGSNCCTN